MDYRPDWPPDNPQILHTCRFVIPDKNRGYRTSFGARATGWTTALNSECLGARMVRNTSNTPFLFAGTATKLYKLTTAGTTTDITRAAGGAYGASKWWFEQFGDDTIACSLADATQTSTSGAQFTALAGAPKAAVMIAAQGHLLALNYNDGVAYQNGINWSSLRSSATWVAAAGNTAGTAYLVETPGKIIGGAAIHDIVVVWKSKSMYIGQRVGGSEVWRFTLLSPSVGLIGQEAWVSTPAGIIFASDTGIYLFDGSVPRPVDGGIRQNIYAPIGAATTESCVMSHDEVSGCVFFWVKGVQTWCYNYITDKWSEAYTGTALGGGSTWTDFKMAVRDNNYEDYKTLGGSLNGARRAHLVFSSEHKMTNLALFSGATGIDPTFGVLNIRDPKASPHQETHLERITPIFGYDYESAAFSEASTGTATVTPKSRISGGAQTAQAALLSGDRRFDVNLHANTFSVSYSFPAQALVVTDFAYTTIPSGDR